MLLGWLLIAVAGVLAIIGSVYDARRKKRIAQLKPGTMYRPFNGVMASLIFTAVLAWNFGVRRVGNSARWLVLALLVVAVFMVVRRWRVRRNARHQPAE